MSKVIESSSASIFKVDTKLEYVLAYTFCAQRSYNKFAITTTHFKLDMHCIFFEIKDELYKKTQLLSWKYICNDYYWELYKVTL